MIRRSFLIALGLLAVTFFLSSSPAFADSLTLAAGYDLFTTNASETSFPGLGSLMGVPLGTYLFPGINGNNPVPVGNADTIIQRTSDVTVANAGDSGSTDITILALQLETLSPVNFQASGQAAC